MEKRVDALPPPAEVLIVLDAPQIPAQAYQRWGNLLVLRQDGEAFSLHGPEERVLAAAPQAALAIVVGPDGTAVTEVAAWAAAQRLECAVIPHSDGLAETLEGLAALRRRTARRSAELQQELAVLRMAQTELVASQAALTELLDAQGLLLPRLGFNVLPDPAGLQLPAGGRDALQPLGVDIRTLCGVALHLAGLGPQAGFSLELRAADDDRAVASWQFARDTQPGWTGFAFPAQAGLAPGAAILRLHWHDEAPPLSLGRVTQRPDLAARVDGLATDRPLAVRAYVSAPGAPAMVTQEMWPARRADAVPVTRIHLALGAALSLLDVRQLHQRVHFAPVAVLEELGHILVHPLEELPTVACLPSVCPPGTLAVRARVATVNAAAGPIEYGLHIPATGGSPGDDPMDAAALAAQVDWTLLTAGGEALLRLDLPAPLPQAADLLLLTRLPAGCSSSAAWAHFTAIELQGAFDSG